MANNPCLKWYTCFHWLTILAICTCFGQCSAGCSDALENTVIVISEAETLGQPIFNISATRLIFDPDSHDNQYKDWLNITETSPGFWKVVLKRAFDADVPEVGTANFKCDRTSNSAGFIGIDLKCEDASTTFGRSFALYLNILDVDEFAPYFEHADSTVTIPESQETGSSVYTLKACDPDSQNVQVVYDIVEYLGGHNGYFNISNRYTGHVFLVKDLDYDSGNTLFVLNISATELPSDGVGLVSYTTLTINVTDVDDLMPKFTDPRYTLSVPEGNYTGREWFNTTPALSARDGDHHINVTIQFRMGPDSQNTGLFSVADNGSIAVNGTLQIGTYNILVEAYQTDKPSLRYVTTIVTITATDVNDHEPEMVQPFYNVTVVENVPVGIQILTVDAKDADVGNNSVIEFHLNGTDNDVFSVETRGHTGVITLKGHLDRESQANYTFEIWAEETSTTEHYSSNKSRIVIIVADVNDHAPVFVSQNYTFNATRTQLKGDFVGKVSAVDADAGDNGEIAYTIQFSTLQPSAFTINNRTGNITLSRDLQYSDVGAHHLSVSAADTGRLMGLTNVQVNILPANTEPPKFGNQSYTFHVLETSTPGSLVGKVTAADGDGDTVVYSSGNINSSSNSTTPGFTTGAGSTSKELTTSTQTSPTVRQDFECHLSYMQVFIPAVLVPNSELTLKDPTCKLNNNGTHHKITFAYDECGTLETFYTDYVDIRNEISVHLILNDTDLITFVEDYKIPLQCSLDRSKILNVAIQVESREQITEHVEHSADFSLKEYTSADYNEEITEYPVKVPLNREIFFEITLRNNSNSSIGVYVEQCVATPSDNPNDTTHVTLIDVGCSAHTAVKVQPSTEIDRFRFSTQAFRFSGDSRIDNLVYIHCSVSTCGGANCQHSCLPHSRRRRRRSARKMTSAILTSGSHVVTS